MTNATDSHDFAHAFGDALNIFLQTRGKSQSEAAKELGLGKEGKARLNAYCHDSPKGTRPKPNAEVLYLLCTKLGFSFEYNGYKISAATLNGSGRKPSKKPVEQLLIKFDSQFKLTDQTGTVSIGVRRPQGRIEVDLSLRGVS